MVSDDLNLDARLIEDAVVALLKRVASDDLDTNARSISDDVVTLFKRLAGEPNPDELLDSHEIAELLKLSDRTLERHRAAGTGPAYIAVGGVIRYLRRDVLAFVERNRRFSTSEVNSSNKLGKRIEQSAGHPRGDEARTKITPADPAVTKPAVPGAPGQVPGQRSNPRRRRPSRSFSAHTRADRPQSTDREGIDAEPPSGGAPQNLQRGSSATVCPAIVDGANTCEIEGSKSDRDGDLAPAESGTHCVVPRDRRSKTSNGANGTTETVTTGGAQRPTPQAS
jgi:hypothetical protein